MSKFEPISRGDAGFVNILHVGRNESGGYFFYVMELADDHLCGGRSIRSRYIPKTLKSELGTPLPAARRMNLPTIDCL